MAALEAGPQVAMSAEQLLERREAERAAAERANGGKTVVKLSALMKYIMAKRAASKTDKERRRDKAQTLRATAKVRWVTGHHPRRR